MPYLKTPLNFGDSGRADAVFEGTREFYDQVIFFAIRTENGELPLEPTFGCSNPVFESNKQSGLRVTIGSFWPEIVVGEIVEGEATAEGIKKINVQYEV